MCNLAFLGGVWTILKIKEILENLWKMAILPFKLGWEREWAGHGYWLLIYHISPQHSGAPINIRGLEARGADRGRALCRRRGHKDKTPRFIYAAWRRVTTPGNECCLDARGISSVFMERINWFCSDFHLCSPELLCSCTTQSSFMMALSWLEKTKQWDDEKFYFFNLLSQWYALASEAKVLNANLLLSLELG